MPSLPNLISSFSSWLSVHSTEPRPIYILLALSFGALVAIYPRSWLATRLLATYIHESGHALVAIVTGRRVVSMKINKDSSGSTLHAGLENAIFSRFLTALAGYPAPALTGWAITLAISVGHARYALGGFILVVSAFLLLQRSVRGFLLTFIILFACLLLARMDFLWMQASLAVLAGYLLLASPRTVVELHRFGRSKTNQGDGIHSDAAVLASMTGISVILWEAIFMLSCLYLAYLSVSNLIG